MLIFIDFYRIGYDHDEANSVLLFSLPESKIQMIDCSLIALLFVGALSLVFYESLPPLVSS